MKSASLKFPWPINTYRLQRLGHTFDGCVYSGYAQLQKIWLRQPNQWSRPRDEHQFRLVYLAESVIILGCFFVFLSICLALCGQSKMDHPRSEPGSYYLWGSRILCVRLPVLSLFWGAPATVQADSNPCPLPLESVPLTTGLMVRLQWSVEVRCA